MTRSLVRVYLLPLLAALVCSTACAVTPTLRSGAEAASEPQSVSPSASESAASVTPADAHALRRMCSERAFAQAALKDCLEAELRASQTALAKAEAALAGSIAAWDEDPNYREAAEAARAIAATAFDTHREAECALAQSLAGGAAGNSRQIMALACAAALNSQRASRLDRHASALPGR